MTTINKQDLLRLVKGACFMASSGGGTYTSGMHLAENFGDPTFYTSGELEVANLDDLEDDKLGVMIAYIGSPKKMEEIFFPKGIVYAVRAIEEKYNTKISYIVPPEIGAISMLAACATAGHLNIPVVDGDGGGRAVPELTMTIFSLYNEDTDPVSLGSENGDVLLLDLEGDVNTASTVEEIVRPVLSLACFDQKAGLAMWVLPGKELKSIIKSKNSISNCIQLGEYIEKQDIDSLFSKADEMGYKPTVVAEGSNIRVVMEVGGGFDNGKIHFTTESEDEISIVFKNESMIAWSSGTTTPLVVAPDLISYLIVFPGETTPQLVYSNTDLATMNPEFLQTGYISLVLLKAPDWMWEIEKQLQGRRSQQLLCLPSGSSVQQSYQSALRSLGYYGRVCDTKNIE